MESFGSIGPKDFLSVLRIDKILAKRKQSGIIVLSARVQVFPLYLPAAILTCVVFSFIGYFNGNSKPFPVMLQGITASFLVRVPLSYLFSLKEGANLADIGIAVPLASVYGIIFFGICYAVTIQKMAKQQLEGGD